MNDVYIKFEGTDREGAVAVGTYLIDAARRLGVEIDCDCATEEPTSQCAVKVVKGVRLLSSPTKIETEHLSASERKDRQRLACQARLEKSGEIELMTVKKKAAEANAPEEESKSSDKQEEFKDEFKEMPLKDKFASLMELELMALGETVSYVVNSPYDAMGKVMDVMAGFGRDLEDQDREAKVPEEHAENEPEKEAEKSGTEKEPKKRSTTARKPKSSKASTAKPRKRRRPVKKEKEEEDKAE